MEAVVIDVGSESIKAGFANPYEDPTTIIPTQVERALDGSTSREIFDPVVRGFVQDWDAMEPLLNFVLYTCLGCEAENEVLFTLPLFTPEADKEKLYDLMFNKFNVSGIHVFQQAVLSLYAIGEVSGCTVDIGHGKIDIAPVYEGAVQRTAKRIEFGGLDLTHYLAQLLKESYPEANLTTSSMKVAKELHACCAEDKSAFEETLKSTQNEQHILPDGQVITISREKYIVGEALFKPLGPGEDMIVEQLVKSISNLPYENRRQCLENTVLCGGTSSMKGFKKRFQRELNLCLPSIRPTLVEVPKYMPENTSKFSAWIGGSILAMVAFPQSTYLTKTDYAEAGSSIVYRTS